MGLISSESFNNQNTYIITNKKYLSVGKFRAKEGFANFLSDELHSITLPIKDINTKLFNSYLKDIVEHWKKPTTNNKNETYIWKSEKLSYSFVFAANLNMCFISILRTKINPLGESINY